VLERDGAIAAWRTLMGATNPANAESGTIRKEFAVDIEKNSVHGSDAPETADYEIKYFFSALEFAA
jgi:nucleoside-diphosphate kinase